ncbi:hypothetical protein BTA51_05135 [Hahella sp. CCB-MM4]|uniref:hypothetical protein n=1 Tax=Hahella sp. (strain CCB-MM4) TaxID=1926491 RepID=UPI000B9A849F|nr:hypothetical protein [Hahella sp. CCB-MM4]OZG74395.1 hypothetical protein BTA51_05135 [Hahella sp. CCB-MM4]
MTNVVATNDLTQAALTANTGTGNSQSSDLGSWYEAMAKAWGSALDTQADKITTLSSEVGENGQDNPSTITMLTAESLRMQFLSNNASTATSSVGQALDALARK